MGVYLGRPPIYKPVSLAFSKREVDLLTNFNTHYYFRVRRG